MRRGDEMKRARRPPLHPNCRSTLIPVVDLIDPKTGEKIEETAERPAQNADGTYSQVAAKTTFKDYFESQSETFQREWLGEKRFELWKSGKLKFEDLAKPATSYRATTADLTSPEEPPKPEPAPVADSPRLTGAAKSFVETLRARRQKTLSADEAVSLEAQESAYAAQRVAAAEANRNARNLEAEFREVNLQALREKDPAKKKELDEREAKTLRALAQARKEAKTAIEAAEMAERERAGTIDVDAFLSALFGDDGDGENVFDDDKIAAIEKVFDAQGVGGAARPILERYNRIARYLGFSEADKDWKKYGFEELEQILFVDLPENAGGEYDDNYCCINLNANELKTRREASSSFAHEVGHWFELRVLGVDSAIKTEEWLRDAINAPPRRSDKELERLGSTFWTLYDLRRCDVTFWRPDYYAAREYPTHSGNDYNYTPYHPTEVMSTAFEGLLTDPEAFARSAPEQFNRVIQAFEDFRKARSKNVDKSNKAPRSDDAKAQTTKTDASRSVVEERREPLFKGPATRGTVVPFELNFSPRVVEFVESVKQSGEFWPDDTKPSNGKRYRDALDKAQRRVQKSGDFSPEELDEIREALIFENMQRNEAEARALLAKEGREILPLEAREKHFPFEGRKLPGNVKDFRKEDGIVAPCTVDLYDENGRWLQRRWYDANGEAEQDYDAAHLGKDVKKSHIFPHIHAWVKNDKPQDDKNSKTTRKRLEGAFMPFEKIIKNDEMDKQ